MKVHQVLSAAGPRDAVTTQALEFRRLFAQWGWGGHDHALHLAPGLGRTFSSFAKLKPAREDVLLLHHSAANRRLGPLLALPNPKLLLYHNVTPSTWLWQDAPVIAAECVVGRDQLPKLVAGVDVCAGVSAYNAHELERAGAHSTRVVPLLLHADRLGTADGEPPDPPRILFVGRFSPHKRQDDVIRAFALYRRHHAPGARLSLVGDAVAPAYTRTLRALADKLAPGAVTIESGLEDSELGARYRSAHAFLCLSEHEGFCAPILEAFQFRVPVIARPAGGIPEVAGDAALLVDDRDLAVVAELLSLAVSDRGLRRELRQRAARRVAEFAPSEVAARLRDAVEEAIRSARARS